MKRIPFFLVIALAAVIAGCSEDDTVVDQGLPESPSALTNLELSGYGFDTDTLDIPDVGEKKPDDPIDIPIAFSVRAVPTAGASVDEIRIVVTPQGSTTAVTDQTFQDPDGNVFSGTFQMNIVRNNADDYNVRVSGTDSRGLELAPALTKIVILNGKYPPVMSDFIAPDSLMRPATGNTKFIITVRVTDQSGPKDIWRVFYSVRKPDGTTSGSFFPLNDDGRDGDAVAGDSIYSAGAQIESTNDLGAYTFEFQAIDRSNLAATPITHKIIVY